MKNWTRCVIVICLAVCSLHAASQVQERDTVYFYDTWEDMFDMNPSSMVISPYIEAETPYAIDIYTTAGDYRLYDHITATLGDSIWLISGSYLMKHFKGDSNKFGYKYIPVFFNEKIAFMTYVGYGDNLSLKNILFGDTGEDIDFTKIVDLYYIDFIKHKVRKVTPEVLSELLEDYHDLQMRYEGMKDYKKRHIIADFFYKYVDRASQDFMRPNILDLVD